MVERYLHDIVNVTLKVLHYAAMEGLLAVSNLLIQKGGANVNIKDNVKRMTPLHLAITKDRYEVCRLLLLRGADITLMCSEGSVLHMCASYL
jgi:ankyrin repeat protein